MNDSMLLLKPVDNNAGAIVPTPCLDQAKSYISKTRMNDIFHFMLSSLVMSKPEDPITFLKDRLADIKNDGLDSSLKKLYKIEPLLATDVAIQTYN